MAETAVAERITEKQLSFIQSLAKQTDMTLEWDRVEVYSKKEASELITGLIAIRDSQTSAYVPELKDEPAASNALQTPVIGKGYYTVTDDEGHRTFRVSPNQKWCDGKTVIAVMTGSDNTTSYSGIGFVTQTGIQLWGKVKGDSRLVALVARLEADVTGAAQLTLEMAKQHVLTSSNCFVCGKLLTEPTSIELGIGPECRKGL